MGQVEKLLTLEELEERARYWQGVLGLRDWTVDIKFERGFNMGVNTATITILEDRRRARILMTEPGDYNPASITPYDMEHTLIHELLHIHLYPFTKTLGECLPEEQAIEAIATALLYQHRAREETEDYYCKLLYPDPAPKLLSPPARLHVRLTSDPEGGFE